MLSMHFGSRVGRFCEDSLNPGIDPIHGTSTTTPNPKGECEGRMLSHVRLFATLLTVAHQAPLSVGFSRQEYWSGLPFPFPNTKGGKSNFSFDPIFPFRKEKKINNSKEKTKRPSKT